MRVHAGNKLEFIFSVVSLAFSVGTLICLAIVFAGCTSSSSPSNLYFMKVNLAEFPKLGALDLRRSVSAIRADISDLSGTVTSEATKVGENAAGSVTQVSATVQTAVSQVSSTVESISNELKLKLPAYYAVGLWGYCQGEKGGGPYSNCSKPSTSFSFDLVDIFRSVSPEMNNVLPSEGNKILSGYHILAKWAISTYMVGFIATASAFTLGSMTILCSLGGKWCEILLVLSSTVATICIIAASGLITGIYLPTTGAVQTVLGGLGAHASIGVRMFMATWLAVGFSILTWLTWSIILVCCCI